MSGGECSSVACWSDWRSVLRLVALMLRLSKFPHTGDPDFCLRILMSRGDCSEVGTNCNMAFSASTMCFRAWTMCFRVSADVCSDIACSSVSAGVAGLEGTCQRDLLA